MSHPALQHLPKGWFHHAEHMLALIEREQPKVIVELGTHNGASAIAMARVIEPWGGVIFCVDTWAGVPGPGKSRTPYRMLSCACAMINAKVSPRVRLMPTKTTDAGHAWNGPPIDCLYVDADHTKEGCRGDLSAWWPHVRRGGIVAGDDYLNPRYPGTTQAWDEWEREQGMLLTRLPTADTNPAGMQFVYGFKP